MVFFFLVSRRCCASPLGTKLRAIGNVRECWDVTGSWERVGSGGVFLVSSLFGMFLFGPFSAFLEYAKDMKIQNTRT